MRSDEGGVSLRCAVTEAWWTQGAPDGEVESMTGEMAEWLRGGVNDR